MMKRIQIPGNHWIGDGEPPFFTAEIGINHNGNLDIALEMIKKAKELGADAVKFQVKDVEEAHPKEMLDMPYNGPNSFGKTYREHKLALEFSHEQLKVIYDYAKKLDILCYSTPCNVNAVKRLEELGNPIYKIAGIFVTNLDLIKEICRTGKPILMSTGCSTVEEIDKAVDLIKKHTDQFALYHSVSCYPTEYKDMNLNAIPTLKNRYGCPVGYSAHERGVGVTATAIALGACMIERHFTLDRTMKGPDHASSLEPQGIELLIGRMRNLNLALGKPEIRIYDCELPNRKKFRGY